MILAVVAFGVFVAADDLTVVATMLRPIIGDLGIVLPDGLDDAAWIVNAYLIAFVAVMPFMGRLSDVIGRRRVYIAAFALFVAGSIIVPLTSSLGPFLFGRILTALGGGAMVPVGMAVIGDVYEEKKRAGALGVLAGVETLGWVWGPLYGAMLVRFLSWHWQFYLNIPLGLIGIGLAWWALAEQGTATVRPRIDWAGAATLTVALVALNIALLGSAEIQSVTGLEELTGGSGDQLRWFYLVALAAGIAFFVVQRRSDDPLIDFDLFRGRNLTVAVLVNFFVGATLVIAMVDVPLFVNVIELDIEDAAVAAGLVLSALTASMAFTSYLGGPITERTWYRPPVVLGLAVAAAAFLVMGARWEADTAFTTMAWQLALLGAGFGLVTAPTSTAVINGAPPDRRGTAASLVIVVRLIGLSVGLAGLTAYGLLRFNQLQPTLELPPIDDPAYQDALQTGLQDLTTSALAETFLAAGVVLLLALAIGTFMRRDADIGTRTSRSDRRIALKDFLTRNLTWVLGILGALVLAVLALNVYLLAEVGSTNDELEEARTEVEELRGAVAIFTTQASTLTEGLNELAPTVGAALDEAVAGLETFSTSTIDFLVPINQDIPIDTQIVLDRTLDVPIQTTLPVDETVETTVTVSGPFGIDVPLDVEVPIQVDFPVDLQVPITVNETIPISTTIPVELEVPISVEVEGTELAALAQSLQQGLESFRGVLEGLGGS